MSYQVLARKWRPKTFEEVVGQETVCRTLQNALTSGRVGHAFLLSGARGVGKTTTARILAKALNCGKSDAPTAQPCGECASCTEIAGGTSLDVHEIDGATNNGVEQVRELRDSARYSPARDRYKVWIIDEVHMLSTGAFNALLKTLEEPPPRVKFIFATTEYHKLPDTILSRCQQYEFRMVPARELQAHMREIATAEKITVSDEALGRIARAAEGSVRDALSLFDQVLAYSGDEIQDADLHALLGLIDRELLTAASQGVLDANSLALLQLVERLANAGADYRNFVRELLLHFREILIIKVAPPESALVAQILPEERARLAGVVAGYSEEDLLRIFDVLTKVETDLRWAQDPRVVLEMALLKLVQLRRLLPFAELVERVERMAGGAPPVIRAVPSAAPAPPVRAVATPAPVKAPAPAPVERAPVVTAPKGDLIAAMIEAASSRPSLLQPLRLGQAEIAGDVCRLIVPSDFVPLAEMHADEYRQLASQVAGRPLKLQIGAGTAAASAEATPSTPSVSPAENRRQDLMQKAANEPVVQEALELFGGRLIDVREGKEGS